MSTPTPEAIEAAARAIAVFDENDWDALLDTDKEDYGILATAALSAAAPFIAAQAKAEALRETAESLWSESLDDAVPRTVEDKTARVIAHRLRARAETIEGKSE